MGGLDFCLTSLFITEHISTPNITTDIYLLYNIGLCFLVANTVTGIIGGRRSDLLSQQRESGEYPGYGMEIYSWNKCGWLEEKLQKLDSLQIKMHIGYAF